MTARGEGSPNSTFYHVTCDRDKKNWHVKEVHGTESSTHKTRDEAIDYAHELADQHEEGHAFVVIHREDGKFDTVDRNTEYNSEDRKRTASHEDTRNNRDNLDNRTHTTRNNRDTEDTDTRSTGNKHENQRNTTRTRSTSTQNQQTPEENRDKRTATGRTAQRPRGRELYYHVTCTLDGDTWHVKEVRGEYEQTFDTIDEAVAKASELAREESAAKAYVVVHKEDGTFETTKTTEEEKGTTDGGSTRHQTHSRTQKTA
jgi:hypothetical protein